MRLISSMGLRFRLVLLVLLAVLPALALTLYANARQRDLARISAQQDILRLVRSAESRQDQLIEGARQLLIAVAQLPAVQGGDAVLCSQTLANLLKQYPQYVSMGATAPNGDLNCSAIPPKQKTNLSDRGYFQQALATRDFAISPYHIGRTSGKPSIIFGYPILDASGAPQGVVFVGLGLAWLQQHAAQAELPPGASLTLIDQQGNLLLSYPDAPELVGKPAPHAELIKQQLGSQIDGASEIVTEQGEPLLLGFSRLRSASGQNEVYLSVSVPAATAFTGLNRMLWVNLAGLGLAAALALAAAWFGGQFFLLRPMDTLLGAMRRVRAGDLSLTIERPASEEFGLLADAFNQMTGELAAARKNLEAQVTERTADLQQTLAELQSHAAEQARLLDEVSQQRQLIRELSVPVLPVNASTLVLPLVGALDSARMLDVQERALETIEQVRARYLVFDITGVPVVDTLVANGILRVVQAARLLGTEVVLVGVRPEVAQAMVGLGIEMRAMRTFSDLQSALDTLLASDAGAQPVMGRFATR